MKASTNWLKEYIDINLPLKEFADGLTMAGLEVEETIALSKDDFVAAGGSGEIEDIVFDVKVTPNRGDWLSLIGVARVGETVGHHPGTACQRGLDAFGQMRLPGSKHQQEFGIRIHVTVQ